ncbi:hypothetical protein HJG60_011340 [Phyllostomus discolor]|uniref:Uncharacterized protein n=1 Tax=Phyllostomus discolor TaxID=89673 RepID=A0A834A4H6_9CHIR|nr:hypothetical protein HJG60_011340 [Phyllostomus discolor]
MYYVLQSCFSCSDTSGGFLSMETSVTTWGTTLGPMYESDHDLTELDMEKPVWYVLIFITALVGLAGNAAVLWLLGFRMRRNAFSVYILSLAGTGCLFCCCQVVYSLQTFIKSSLVLLTRLLCGSQQVQPTRLYVTVGLTVLVFLCCGLPFSIHWFLIV